ncbi:hypothetical protein M9434_004451 [Picochlorum sp. BPE23]|nr:hypothetical protein M9434_004451 [Picochlorum sp. BPE23]
MAAFDGISGTRFHRWESKFTCIRCQRQHLSSSIVLYISTHTGIDTIMMKSFSPRWVAAVVVLILCLTLPQQMVHGMAEYTVEDVATHNSTANGIWVGYNGKVYDITEWVPQHPGGAEVLIALAGTIDEFTKKFNARHGPGSYQEGILKEYEIGTLVT